MDKFIDERDYALLQGDKYTFSVLTRIIGGECEFLLSDHERLIICHTCQPFPLWIWTPDNATKEEMEKAYMLVKDNNFLDGLHRFNIKYSLAEYFMDRAKKDGRVMSIETNMFAYDCPMPIAPKCVSDGEAHKCTHEDIDILTDFYEMFHDAVETDKEDKEAYRIKAENAVKYGSLYLWKNSDGVYTASCSWHPINDMATVGLVYTREQFRRMHYAENLVYHVTMVAKEAGFLPMLYTDADYEASNRCYEKIGYVLKGKLCTIV